MRSLCLVCSPNALLDQLTLAGSRLCLGAVLVVGFLLNALPSRAAPPTISWTNNLLTLQDSRLPTGKLEIWYLEAFCRSGAAGRVWDQTKLPHTTVLLRGDPQHLAFRTLVPPAVEVRHEVSVSSDGLEMLFELTNTGKTPVDLQWFEPACIRVEEFTGCNQTNYTDRSFIFTTKGLTRLSQLRRRSQAVYLGGQVYLPPFVASADANPRPVCLDHPVNGLIGCFSKDDKWLLATASDRTHELFEGVYVCLHSDPSVNGLKPGETKRRRSKLYILPNDPKALVRDYQRDFPHQAGSW